MAIPIHLGWYFQHSHPIAYSILDIRLKQRKIQTLVLLADRVNNIENRI